MIGRVAVAAALVIAAPPAAAQSRAAEVERALNELAAAYAVAGRTLAPIPLDPAPSPAAIALMPIHRKVLLARAQAAAGEPVNLPIETRSARSAPGVTVIARPTSCRGRPVGVREIVLLGKITPDRRGPVRVADPRLGDFEIAAMFPGLEVAPGSRATTFFNRTFLRDDVVVVHYEDSPCAELAGELRLPVEMEMPRQLLEAHAPESARAGTVRMLALIDIDGTPFNPRVLEADPQLQYDALRLAAEWRFEPGTINGVTVPLSAGFHIRFGSGERRRLPLTRSAATASGAEG